MMAPPTCSRTVQAFRPAVAAVLLFWMTGAAATASARGAWSAQQAEWQLAGQASLVRCTPVAMPAQARGNGHQMVRQAGDGRFFAPTRQAMFFSHPGDRCVWHGAGLARG